MSTHITVHWHNIRSAVSALKAIRPFNAPSCSVHTIYFARLQSCIVRVGVLLLPGDGVLFSIDFFVSLFVYLFVCLFLYQQHYEQTAWPICMKFSGEIWSDHGTAWLLFLVNLKKPRDAAMRNTGTGFVVLSHHRLLLLLSLVSQLRLQWEHHMMNSSSSPVLTATCLSYGTFCDFLGFFFPNRPRGHTPRPILTQNGSNDVGSRKDVPFGVKIATFWNPWLADPKTAKICPILVGT